MLGGVFYKRGMSSIRVRCEEWGTEIDSLEDPKDIDSLEDSKKDVSGLEDRKNHSNVSLKEGKESKIH